MKNWFMGQWQKFLKIPKGTSSVVPNKLIFFHFLFVFFWWWKNKSINKILCIRWEEKYLISGLREEWIEFLHRSQANTAGWCSGVALPPCWQPKLVQSWSTEEWLGHKISGKKENDFVAWPHCNVWRPRKQATFVLDGLVFFKAT